MNKDKPFWTLVNQCVDAHKDLFAFYKNGIRTGPIREIRMYCMNEYNKYKEWGF